MPCSLRPQDQEGFHGKPGFLEAVLLREPAPPPLDLESRAQVENAEAGGRGRGFREGREKEAGCSPVHHARRLRQLLLCRVSKERPRVRRQAGCCRSRDWAGSEIASCNYPARKFGVKNGMWMKRLSSSAPT